MSTRALSFPLAGPLALSLALTLPIAGCGAEPPTAAEGADAGSLAEIGSRPAIAPVAHPARYATTVVSLSLGEGGGFGKDQLPGIIQGAPVGGGCCYGSTDVLSLGDGGEVVLGFDAPIVDGDGPDLVVFENPFRIANDPNNLFTEYGEVSVSEDGVTWTSFPCDPAGGARETCAGWREVYATPDDPVDVTTSARAGGDPFDLATIGVKQAKLVRIRDLRAGRPAQAGMAGFDLDAVAALHW